MRVVRRSARGPQAPGLRCVTPATPQRRTRRRTKPSSESAYAGFYRPPSGRFSGGGDRVLRRTRGLLAGRLDRLAPPGPILDVGCGEGALLDALESTGRVAVGLEQGDQAAHARLDVREVEIVDFDERPGEWAAVVFWHSLEHLRDPRAALRRASALLATSGLLVIAVPNCVELAGQVVWRPLARA